MQADDRELSARRKAQDNFTSAQGREDALRKEIEKARNLNAAKTARLRALRLAKEAADKAEMESRPAQRIVSKKKV